MANWFNSLSRGTLAVLVLGLGIAFIVFSDPPKTICDAQFDLLKDSLRGFLSADNKTKSKVKTTKYKRLSDHCKRANNPGGCYELFSELRKMDSSLDKLSPQCRAEALNLAPLKVAVWDSLELMIEIAWGEKPPTSYHERLGWLDQTDLALFCQLKDRSKELWGGQRWNEFRERMMIELPDAANMDRDKVWQLILLSINCQAYI